MARTPRYRKVDKNTDEKQPLATDMMVASMPRRFAAMLLDIILILLLTWSIGLPVFKELYYTMSHAEHYQSPVRILSMALFCCWALYVVGFNASKMRATPGQRLMSIQVCTVFGLKLTPLVAATRFVLFASPYIILLVTGVDNILGVMPLTSPMMLDVDVLDMHEHFVLLLCFVVLVQLWLIYPCFMGRSDRVLWDVWCHSRVLKRI